MSNEMPSWRSLASSATRSIKGYVAQRDLRRSVPASRDIRPGAAPDGSNRSTWSQWAGQKIRSIGQGDNQVVSTENLCLFPGWACRRYAPSRNATLQGKLVAFLLRHQSSCRYLQIHCHSTSTSSSLDSLLVLVDKDLVRVRAELSCG